MDKQDFTLEVPLIQLDCNVHKLQLLFAQTTAHSSVLWATSHDVIQFAHSFVHSPQPQPSIKTLLEKSLENFAAAPCLKTSNVFQMTEGELFRVTMREIDLTTLLAFFTVNLSLLCVCNNTACVAQK